MRIRTSRLELREYTMDDLPAWLAYHADPRAREFYGPDEGRPDQLTELLQAFVAWSQEQPRRNWQLAITRRDAPGIVMGSCGVRCAGMERHRGELGIDLSPELWGRGYGPEAAGAMLDLAFGALRLEQVHCITVAANTRATALLGRLGFRPVAQVDGSSWMTGRGGISQRWELSRADWRSVRNGVGEPVGTRVVPNER